VVKVPPKACGTLRNRITVLRAERGLSQKELAELTGVSRQTIVALEKNRYNPSLKLAFQLATIFDVDINDVFQFNIGGN